MSVVWPVTALYAGPLGLWCYWRIGRENARTDADRRRTPSRETQAAARPFWQSVAVAATHCGGGCTLGDLVGERLARVVPLTLLGREIYAAWAVDSASHCCSASPSNTSPSSRCATCPPAKGLAAAIKADVLSLTAWQVGMYGWMAIATFVIFGHELAKTEPVFWFMMQIAMLAGFATSYPVNWWLLKAGIKEEM